jgi:hypothetical protein
MTGGAVIFIAASLAAGALLGALRATTVRVWREQERFMRQGTWLTAVLWLVSVGGHVGAAQLLSGSAAQADRVARSCTSR